MRLLSNLYKQRFITNESESRVINSNTLAYRILEEQSRALAKTREPEQPQAESGGFVEGIAAPQVETIDYEAEAKEKAEEILAQANAEADEIRKAAREEADEIRKQAQEQGQADLSVRQWIPLPVLQDKVQSHPYHGTAHGKHGKPHLSVEWMYSWII